MNLPGWHDPWPAPAKLNLFLHVVGRREDGYHLLQTVFTFIDHADSLRFEPRHDDRIVLATPLPGVPVETDLCLRAAQALRQASGVTAGVTIHLEKRLPMGGGLGGGSSDAATTLMALDTLWRTGLGTARLQQIGLSLGADVPIFIHGRAAFAEGVGERFTDIRLAPAWYLVLMPPVAVPTPLIFASPTLCRNTAAIRPGDWHPGFGMNDLQPVACELFPEIAHHLAYLQRFGDARLSGSGACCFVAFSDPASAAKALATCPPGMLGFVARGLERHPVFFEKLP